LSISKGFTFGAAAIPLEATKTYPGIMRPGLSRKNWRLEDIGVHVKHGQAHVIFSESGVLKFFMKF